MLSNSANSFSYIVNAIALVRERNPLNAEVCIDNQVAREDLGGHDLTYLGVDDLLP